MSSYILLGILVIIFPNYSVKGLRLLDEDLNNIMDILKPALVSQGKEENKARHNNLHLSDTLISKLLASKVFKEKRNNHHTNNVYRLNSDSNLDRENPVNLNELSVLYKYLANSVDEKDDRKNDVEQEADSNAYDLNLSRNPNSEDRLNLNDYSKIYLLLDPKANIKPRDIEEISNLVTSVFRKELKDKRYKGFVIRDNSRRRRNSKESYSKRDSMEVDYKPKRARSDHKGGGRTAIPYIRHRGDIYEKPSEFD